MKNGKRIHSVTIKRMIDESPDTSWLGEYSNKATSQFSIDRAHDLDCLAQTYNQKPTQDAIEFLERAIAHLENVKDSIGLTPGYYPKAPIPELWAASNQAQDILIEAQADIEHERCNCGNESDRWNNREYRYFNPSFNYIDKADKPASWEESPTSVIVEKKSPYQGVPQWGVSTGSEITPTRSVAQKWADLENAQRKPIKRQYTHDEVIKMVRQDYERMESLNAGNWGFIGIGAQAEILIPNSWSDKSFNAQMITSGGLWGIESDSDRDYLESVEKEELSSLREQLKAIGFSSRAISTAFKTIERKEE